MRSATARTFLALFFGASLLAAELAARGQETPPPSPSPTPAVSPTVAPSVPPSATPSETPSVAPSATPTMTPTPLPTPTPTPPPITVTPQNVQVPIGTTQTVTVGGVLGTITAVAQDPKLVDVTINQDARTLNLAGKAPGATNVTITDARGVSATLGVRVAYNAGAIAPYLALQITGDPASADFIKDLVARNVRNATQARAGAQIIVTNDDVPFNGRLRPDNVRQFDVPVLVQGNDYFSVQGRTHVMLENIAAPRISPDALLVSDFPERLTENGILFTADLHRDAPSRFLYFHYNPPQQPDRRIVLVADNPSNEPAIVQFIDGRGGPSPNEMEVGHVSTRNFLVNVVQNQGRLITLPPNSTQPITMQEMPAGAVVANMLQLRVLNGANVHLTLVAQNAGDDPATARTTGDLLSSTVRHARGRYDIPEFHDARQWNVNDPYLELTIGQIPLPNKMQGEALAGDYGVLQSFVVNVQNPYNSPQAVAIYENPRGGRATGTFLIDGVLVQSHQTPPFSRYKVRQYVVPARGFVRISIVTIPEGGSSYPLKLIFAPDDGSVSPGAPGSPIY